jgi:hypothetical protein
MRAVAAAVLATLPAAAAGLEIVPQVGADFEHFGETYRVTAERDTVTAIDDWGSFAGLVVRTPGRAPSRFEADVQAYAGSSTRRARLRFDGRLASGANAFEIRQEAAYRVFQDDGDYAVTGDHLEQRMDGWWDRRLGAGVTMRLRDAFWGTWYEDPDAYNLTMWTHEPRAEVRFDLQELSRARLGYRFAKRDVPDSTTLAYTRHGGDAELSWWIGETAGVDLAATVERREYPAASVRESSWETRTDARLELARSDRTTLRLLHEGEFFRYDEPDELDFDSAWVRSAVQIEFHRTSALDLAIAPVVAFLASATAADEEYVELGIEVGVDWRFGRTSWLGVTNEVGRRDYGVDAVDDETTGAFFAEPVDTLDSASSDYVFDRFTLMLGATPWPGLTASLFLHWQPEDHDVSRHDSDTQIASGGVQYAF